MSEQPQGCARITGTVTGEEPGERRTESGVESRKETIMNARVGKQAPDFTAPAYYQGKFTNVKLSDFKGKWVLLCFYPGDFTFV